MNNSISVHDQQKHGEPVNGTKNGRAASLEAGSDASAKKRTSGPAEVPDVRSDAKADVEAAAETIKNAADRAKEVLGKAERGAQEALNDLKERMAPVDAWVRSTTSEHPYLVVGTAVGVSFMAGFMVRRRAAVTAGVAVGFLAGCLLSGQSIAMAKKVAEKADKAK